MLVTPQPAIEGDHRIGSTSRKPADQHSRSNHDTWPAILARLARQKGTIRIVTYSLADMEQIRKQLGHRSKDIWLICHNHFKGRATEIKGAFPDMKIAVRDNIYAKVLLVAPKTVHMTSVGAAETTMVLRTREAHNEFVEGAFNSLWENATEVTV